MSSRGHAVIGDRQHRRRTERQQLAVPGQLTWRDTRGTIRFAAVTTRDVSDFGVFVECLTGPEISLYRMAYLHIDLDVECH